MKRFLRCLWVNLCIWIGFGHLFGPKFYPLEKGGQSKWRKKR